MESVASYFHRLARVHQVTIGQLTQVVCNQSPYLRIGEGPEVKWRALYPAMLCSYSRQTEVLVHRLEKLTGEKNLARGTLLPLRENICRNQTGALEDTRRWCPKCYSTATDDFAEPLIWMMPLVSRCPIHDVPLERRCPHCGATQRAWRAGPLRKTCFKCRHSLTLSSADSGTSEWEGWCQHEMLKLVEHISSSENSGLAPDMAKEFIANLPRESAQIVSRGASIRELRKAQSKWPGMRPRMKTIFKIASAWGTSPLDILLRPSEAASPSLFEVDVPMPLPPVKRSFHEQSYRSCERRLQQLMKLPREVLLPPPTHVCRTFRVSNHFQLRCSEVWKKYMTEKNCRLNDHKENKILLANRYMEKRIELLKRSGERLHRRNAISAAMLEIRVSKTVARSALRVALLEMRMNEEESRTARLLASDS